MEEMDKEQFESMLGTESVDRINYLDLLENIKLHINSSAMIGMMLMNLTENTQQIINDLGIEQGRLTIEKILKIITMTHMLIAKDLAQEHVLKHHTNLYGTPPTPEDFLNDNTMETTRAHMQKIIGFDVLEMLDVFHNEDPEGEE